MNEQELDKHNRAGQSEKKLQYGDESSDAKIELPSLHNQLILQKNEIDRLLSELANANAQLALQDSEREKRAYELTTANRKLIFENEQKEQRAAELLIANKELAFQNEEKEKRAQELIIANKELEFESIEKEKRAAELIIANKELAHQTILEERRKAEKEKRAAELVAANRELHHQENRAAELQAANKELTYQIAEKEKKTEELILANSELKKAEEELGSFSYSVSHDLRAPIRAINGYSKILLEDYAEKFDQDGLKVLNAVIHSSKKMGQLIDDLLAFSKLGRKQVVVSAINMKVLVSTVLEEIPIDEDHNVPKFVLGPIPEATGDQSLIRQVWINLISNAIKYSRNKPETCIEIGAEANDREIIYFVKDFGAGFDMEYYDKLFGVFQRLHSQEEFEGTGIGLAIVQKIIDRHRGKVWAESTLNEGSVFYFSLPVKND